MYRSVCADLVSKFSADDNGVLPIETDPEADPEGKRGAVVLPGLIPTPPKV